MTIDVQGQRDAGRLALINRIRAEVSRAEDLYAGTLMVFERSKVLIEVNRRIRASRGQPLLLTRELLECSPYARLVARLASAPVIEQAKGIVMAQAGSGDEQAFDVLRRASQRLNVPVRELAAQVVARAAQREVRVGQGRASHARG